MQVSITKALYTINFYNNNRSKVYIDENFLISTDIPEKKRLQDEMIVATFFKIVAKDTYQSLTLETWAAIKKTLYRLVDQDERKKEIQRRIDLSIQEYTDLSDPLAKVKRLIGIHKMSGTLHIQDLRFLEVALERLATERISCIGLTLAAIAEWHKYVVGDIYEKMGGGLKACGKNTLTIDWERCPKQSPEEFAMAARLEGVHQDGKGCYLPILKKLLSESPECAMLQIWRTFYAFCEFDFLNTFFLEELMQTRGPISSYCRDQSTPFFAIELKDLFDEMKTMAKNTSFLALPTQAAKKAYLRERTEKMLVPAQKYYVLHNDISTFYTTLYDVVEDQKKKHRGYIPEDISLLVGSRLPTPAAFHSWTIPSLSLDVLEEKIKCEFATYSVKLTQSDDAFSMETFLNYLYGDIGETPIARIQLARFCKAMHISRPKRQEKAATSDDAQSDFKQLAEEIAKLYITKPKQQKSKKPGSTHRRPHTVPMSAKEIEKLPAAKPIKIRQIELPITPDFSIEQRVRDYHMPDRDDDGTLFHSYPFLVTQIMRKYVLPEDFQSPTTQKINTLYSRAGTIHRYGQGEESIQGYFADCFDENSLYHHFFHKTLFTELIQRYRDKHPLVINSERHSIAQDRDILTTIISTQTATFVQGSLHDRFQLEIKRYSIEIDDTARKIRYTLCFPEWVA